MHCHQCSGTNFVCNVSLLYHTRARILLYLMDSFQIPPLVLKPPCSETTFMKLLIYFFEIYKTAVNMCLYGCQCICVLLLIRWILILSDSDYDSPAETHVLVLQVSQVPRSLTDGIERPQTKTDTQIQDNPSLPNTQTHTHTPTSKTQITLLSLAALWNELNILCTHTEANKQAPKHQIF